MRLVTRNWNPWRDVDQLQNEISRIFSRRRSHAGPNQAEFPPVNVWQDEQSLIITAEVPGLAPEDLDITVTTDSVTIRGKRHPETLKEEESYYRQERPTDPFGRTIELPFEVDPQQTEAVQEKGILTLKLHRPEEQKPRKIVVKAG